MPFVDHVGPPPGDVVHHPADCLFVARNLPRREHHHVVVLNLDVPVIVDGDPRQRGLRLSLRAGADDDDVLRREVADVAVANLHAGRDPQVAKPLGNLRVLDHAPSGKSHAAVELSRQIDDDLHPVEAGREHRHDDSPVGAGEHLLETVDDVPFRTADAFALDVGAVAEQDQHPGRAQLGEAVEVDHARRRAGSDRS